jgi:hypothetical protein
MSSSGKRARADDAAEGEDGFVFQSVVGHQLREGRKHYKVKGTALGSTKLEFRWLLGQDVPEGGALCEAAVSSPFRRERGVSAHSEHVC